MKVELHCHTNRYSACARNTPAELVERMVQLGYEAVYLTEHDAVWADWEIEQLQQGFPDIRLFPGLELTVTRRPLQHLLILGTTDPTYLRMDDPAEILAKARAEGHLTILAHPFRFEGGAAMLDDGHRPDALEYLSRNHPAELAAVAKQVADRLDLRLVNAGDTHALDHLNRFWIETDWPITRADRIREIILNKAYVNWTSEGDV